MVLTLAVVVVRALLVTMPTVQLLALVAQVFRLRLLALR
jgi:hypothetical protein